MTPHQAAACAVDRAIRAGKSEAYKDAASRLRNLLAEIDPDWPASVESIARGMEFLAAYGDAEPGSLADRIRKGEAQ